MCAETMRDTKTKGGLPAAHSSRIELEVTSWSTCPPRPSSRSLPPSSDMSHLNVCEVGDTLTIVYLDLMILPPILSSPVQFQVLPTRVPVACPIMPMLSKPMYL